MLLEFRNVSKIYPSANGDIPVLTDVSLMIKTGDSLGIMGPSGSGKSTLINIMGALDRPSAGQVLMEGRDTTLLAERELAGMRNRDIGFVFQLHHLLPPCTVLENVLVPILAGNRKMTDADAEDRAKRLLDRVGLAGCMNRLPGRLSGGECQRVAVVRSLINKPKLLLADEPTGSLDQTTAENLGQLLVELNREEHIALVVVTHSPALAARMETTLRLEKGRLKKDK
jgi:ABC-type lipoprotein export system ATPase subunit